MTEVAGRPRDSRRTELAASLCALPEAGKPFAAGLRRAEARLRLTRREFVASFRAADRGLALARAQPVVSVEEGMAGWECPALLREIVLRHAPGLQDGWPFGPALELGCGANLGAVALEDLLVGPFRGVEGSPAMLRRAADARLYSELRDGEPLQVLKTERRAFGLVLAAGTFRRCGALDAALAGLPGLLAEGGFAVVGLETDAAAGSAGWMLRRPGMYAHAPDYAASVIESAGLRMLEAPLPPPDRGPSLFVVEAVGAC